MGVHGIVPPATFADPVVLLLGLTDCAEADEVAGAVTVAVDAVTAELAGGALGEALFTELLVHAARASEAAIRHVQHSMRDIDAPRAAAMDVPGMPAGAAAQPLTGSNLGWPSRSTRAWDLQTPHGPGRPHGGREAEWAFADLPSAVSRSAVAGGQNPPIQQLAVLRSVILRWRRSAGNRLLIHW